eukprot:834711-Rhodomonas_salina.1
MSGTDIAYSAVSPYARAMQCPVLTERTPPYPPPHLFHSVRYLHSALRTTFLRTCYAMSGTEIAHSALPAYSLALRCP